jgi:hypothetical protein
MSIGSDRPKPSMYMWRRFGDDLVRTRVKEPELKRFVVLDSASSQRRSLEHVGKSGGCPGATR